MITTQMNDWNRQLNGIPWTRKERPGLRSLKAGRPMQAAGPRRTASCVSTAPITPWIAMPNAAFKPSDARKQRLLREAHGSDSDEISSVENALVILLTAVLALAIYWGAVAVVMGSATVKRNDVVQQNAATAKKDIVTSTAAADATDPSRRLINQEKNSQ